MLGNTTRSNISRRRFLVMSSQSLVCNHSLAMTSNVLVASFACLTRSSCLCWAGFTPSLTSLRAASLRSRASDSFTAGYSPSPIMLDLPFSAKRYRHAFTPVGLTSKYRPRWSLSRYSFSFGLALRQWASVSNLKSPCAVNPLYSPLQRLANSRTQKPTHLLDESGRNKMRLSETEKPRKGAVLMGFGQFHGVSKNTVKLNIPIRR